MLFNSIHFIIFFILVIGLYFTIPHKHRWVLLLIASYYFYMSWKAEYAILMLISTGIDYVAARIIETNKEKIIRKTTLIFSLCSNLGLLFAFKYFNFVNESVRELLQQFSINFSLPYLNVLLPVGISFYTFQTMSYTIDVYQNKIKAEKNIGIFALYVSFFPQLVAGPIERASHLLPQFYKENYFEYQRVTNGLKLMLWGFFKKVVIADRVAVIVDQVYNNVHSYTGFILILATILFAYQIYCDFSGYCDIAIGSAQIMGFSLMDNFKRPYFAKSIAEFWKKWHISLSSWFRDYVYITLGGNKVAVPRWYCNILIVFLLSGIWHGANWTFMAWGALHGAYLIFGIILKPTREKIVQAIKLDRLPKARMLIQIAGTFILVNLGWIFFRANSLADASYIITHLTTNFSESFWSLIVGSSQISRVPLFIGIGTILFMEAIHLFQEHRGMRHFLNSKPKIIRWTTYVTLLVLILALGVFDSRQFIYFQF